MHRPRIPFDICDRSARHILMPNSNRTEPLPQRLEIPHRGECGRPFAAIIELTARAANHHHMPRPRHNQLIGNQPAALLMVGTYRGNRTAQCPVERDNGPMNRRPVMLRMIGMGGHDDSVHHMPAQAADILRLTGNRISCRTQQSLQFMLREPPLQRGHQRREKRMTQCRHNHADHAGPPAIQIACQLVGDIVQFAHRLLDTATHILRNVSGSVHHQRYGA